MGGLSPCTHFPLFTKKFVAQFFDRPTCFCCAKKSRHALVKAQRDFPQQETAFLFTTAFGLAAAAATANRFLTGRRLRIHKF